MKRLFCILLVLCLVLPFCGCEKSYKAQIAALDKALELYTQKDSDDEIYEQFNRAGFLTSKKQLKSSEFEAFTEAYLESHSLKSLFDALEILMYYESNVIFKLPIHSAAGYDTQLKRKDDFYYCLHCGLSGGEKGCKCFCQLVSEYLDYLIENYLDSEALTAFDDTMEGKGDFYENNPNAEPQPYTRTVSSTGHGSKTATGTVEYYGDFAISYEEIPYYKDGYLGWKDGVFIDKSGGWTTPHYYRLYYKGTQIASRNGVSKSEFFDEIARNQILCVDGNYYILLAEEEEVLLSRYGGEEITEIHSYISPKKIA